MTKQRVFKIVYQEYNLFGCPIKGTKKFVVCKHAVSDKGINDKITQIALDELKNKLIINENTKN
jgi:hypothetical protein